jgi:glycosyltransferase involved in cell wall biosynthesis
MATKTPGGPLRISVIIPVHNPGDLLNQALDSVLAQTRPADEILVVDDGSEQDVAAVFGADYPGVAFHRRPHRGVSAARNAGISLARGDLIAFLDGDDLFLPDKLERQAAVFARHPQACLVNSGWQVIDEAGAMLATVRPWEQAPKLDLKTWLLWKPVLPGALVVRRQSLLAVGGFDEGLSHAEDVDLVLRLSLAGCRCRWLRQPTLRYRRHGGSVSMDLARQADGILHVLDSFFARPDLPHKIRIWRKAVRYYTLLWVLEQQLAGGRPADLAGYLRAAMATRSLSAELAALEVATDLQERIRQAGLGAATFRRLYPGFRQSLAMEDESWDRFARSLELGWLLGAEMQVPGAGPFDGAEWRAVDPDQFFRMLQFNLMRRPSAGILDRLAHVWRQALAAGLIPPGMRTRLVTLYLTVMAWAVYNRAWRIAAVAAIRAAAGAGSAGGLRAWSRFLRAAGRYYLDKLRRQPDDGRIGALLMGPAADGEPAP